ncbi:hypothetical protein AMS68_003116 [Peltaster fructicola]|uniref:Uncharacterized protein n=1 Tax=Peltaster fructicola TaxID=286661 RepID=A0A6H0XSK3_9PEZI|nr:hypothetical protein AMS68_003116 [Peltaster fructicola]
MKRTKGGSKKYPELMDAKPVSLPVYTMGPQGYQKRAYSNANIDLDTAAAIIITFIKADAQQAIQDADKSFRWQHHRLVLTFDRMSRDALIPVVQDTSTGIDEDALNSSRATLRHLAEGRLRSLSLGMQKERLE